MGASKKSCQFRSNILCDYIFPQITRKSEKKFDIIFTALFISYHVFQVLKMVMYFDIMADGRFGDE
ncbi:MAG: hypothetical protein ACJZ14_02625 [Candidatus Neomarinimicrobiota bacterium]